MANNRVYDVAIIGAGVVGCALARELSRYSQALSVLVLDRCEDVGEGTSKANAAIVHTGYDAEPGSLEAKLVTKASAMWPDMASRLKIPFRKTGALVLATTAEQLGVLEEKERCAHDNGVNKVAILGRDRVKEMEPNVRDDVLGALYVQDEAIADPFTTCTAFAAVAMKNGVDIRLRYEVRRIDKLDAGYYKIMAKEPDEEHFHARNVVNAAGLGSRRIGDMYGAAPFEINPRRGQFAIYARDPTIGMLNHILLPLPDKKLGKGMLVAPTIFGCILAGPTAEDLTMEDYETRVMESTGKSVATSVTPEGIDLVMNNAKTMLPPLQSLVPINTYAGARCQCAGGQYLLRYNDGGPGLVTVTGIRSTGLSSSPALAQEIVQGMVANNCLQLPLHESPTYVDELADYPEWWKRLVRSDEPNHASIQGKPICPCEGTTDEDVVQALTTPSGVRAQSLAGIKRRTRATAGPCQGDKCRDAVEALMERHLCTTRRYPS